MTRIWQIMLVAAAASTPLTSMGVGQDKIEKPAKSVSEREAAEEAAKRKEFGDKFDELERAAFHDPLKGEIARLDFFKAMRKAYPQEIDGAAQLYKQMTRPSEGAVTKTEFVEHHIKSWKKHLKRAEENRAKIAKLEQDRTRGMTHEEALAPFARRGEKERAERIQKLKSELGDFPWYVLAKINEIKIDTFRGFERIRSVQYSLAEGSGAAAAALCDNPTTSHRFWGFQDKDTAQAFLQTQVLQAKKAGFQVTD